MREELLSTREMQANTIKQILVEQFRANHRQFVENGGVTRDAASLRLGVYLRTARHRLRLSRRDVAERTQLSRAALVALEEGALSARQIDPAWLEALADALDAPLDTLLLLAQPVRCEEKKGGSALPTAAQRLTHLGNRVIDAVSGAVFDSQWDVNGRFFLPAPLIGALLLVYFCLAALPYVQYQYTARYDVHVVEPPPTEFNPMLTNLMALAAAPAASINDKPIAPTLLSTRTAAPTESDALQALLSEVQFELLDGAYVANRAKVVVIADVPTEKTEAIAKMLKSTYADGRITVFAPAPSIVAHRLGALERMEKSVYRFRRQLLLAKFVLLSDELTQEEVADRAAAASLINGRIATLEAKIESMRYSEIVLLFEFDVASPS